MVYDASRASIIAELVTNHSMRESNAVAVLEQCMITVHFYNIEKGTRIQPERYDTLYNDTLYTIHYALCTRHEDSTREVLYTIY